MAKKRKGKQSESKMREALQIVSKGVVGMTTVSHMQEEILCPTIFTSLNRATGVGGIPKRKMIAIHGKNATGKSVGAVGITESLRRAGDVPVKYDCEYADEKRWMNRLVLGDDTLFDRPLTMDDLFNKIQQNLDNLMAGKAAKKIAKEIGLAIVIDTLTKLIPKEQWNTILKKGYKKSYPMAAAWVSVWSKMIVPQAYRSNSTFVIVLQDRQNMDRGPDGKGKKRKPTLGEALLYDVSVMIEFTYSSPVKITRKKKDIIVGSEHHFVLEKNKVDGFTAQKGSIFTSTGKGDVPAGFDYVREAIAEARHREVAKQSEDKTKIVVDFRDDSEPWETAGGWESFREHLGADPDDLQRLIDKLNAQSRRIE